MIVPSFIDDRERFPAIFTLSCPFDIAEHIRKKIMSMDLFDPERSIGKDRYVSFPIIFSSREEARRFLESVADHMERMDLKEGTSGTLPRNIVKKPHERVLRILEKDLDPQVLEKVPNSYDRLGDSLVLRMRDVPFEYRKRIAGAFKEVLGSRFVLGDVGGVSGELRKPEMEVLSCPPNGDFEVVHREGKTLYRFDPRSIMFSPGNMGERTGFPERVKSGQRPPRFIQDVTGGSGGPEIVVDMFAGIGYFTLPLARNAGKETIILAVEKNPVSFGYLKENISLNGVEERVIPILGDNRRVLPDGVADRIIMGYVGGTREFMGQALRLSRPEGSIIHFHDTVEEEVGCKGLFGRLSAIAGSMGRTLDLLWAGKVKTFAPRIDHLVLDVLVGPST